MGHIAIHFQNRARREDMRPDFFLIEHMRKKGLLSAEDYKWAIRHTESPACDGLVGYKPREMKKKVDKSREHRHDLEKEDRQRRRRDSRGRLKRRK